ncbi:MAG TPA: universal stress protein, partial [Candidatus Thermoplasmatota archaeon]|nr:universal stress protein [Candidatus Thermoplasmatota archaeon]
VLYVDDSSNWHQAARLLADYVRKVGGEVTVTSAALLAGTRRRVMEQAKAILALPEGQVRMEGRAGLVEHVLPDVAREVDADVVVVGRLGAADRVTSGLIGHLIVKRTPCSVLIARGKPDSIRSVLVCTEGSRHGTENFRRAARIAKSFGARLTVLHVLSQMSLLAHEPGPTQKEFLASDDPVAAHLKELQRRMREDGIEGEVQVRQGLVVEEVLDALREGKHDLLVIGAHETTEEKAVLYDDIASHILRSSPVSTLVVRDRSRR